MMMCLGCDMCPSRGVSSPAVAGPAAPAAPELPEDRCECKRSARRLRELELAEPLGLVV